MRNEICCQIGNNSRIYTICETVVSKHERYLCHGPKIKYGPRKWVNENDKSLLKNKQTLMLCMERVKQGFFH